MIVDPFADDACIISLKAPDILRYSIGRIRFGRAAFPEGKGILIILIFLSGHAFIAEGLGLYLVKTIINAHDEDIAVRSEDGMTEFVFTLTLAENSKQGREKT